MSFELEGGKGENNRWRKWFLFRDHMVNTDHYHADIEFDFCLGDHILKVFQVPAGEFWLFCLVCFNAVTFKGFNYFG